LKVADLETDKLGRLYSTGYFMSTCDLDPGPDTLALTSNGGFDTYLLSLDTSGNLLWGKSFGGNNNETPTGMSVSENFVINTTGLFSGNADFHIESDSFHYVNSAGNHDIFIHQVSVFACKEFDVTILVNKDTLTIAEDFISYQWMLNGDTIQGATGKSYIATLNGHYQVAFVDENGCEGISRLYEVNNLGIPVTNEKNIFIYPNPGSERIY